jgi:hydroxymethylbilane synthase
MNEFLRIGTRDSKLASWQAEHVAEKLKKIGIRSELVFIKSEGDLDLTTPLAEMGGKGVFTKALDDALINDEIDLAVHSFKDLPTINPLPLKVAAILKREDPRDALVAPAGTDFLDSPEITAVIATSSNRRKAQWLHRYPDHEITNIRGNVQTRLRKVHENGWNGAIFAAAGLIRINLDHHIAEYLDWMVPAPAQGAVAVMIHEENRELSQVLGKIEHEETAICTRVERELLNRMEAGCSAPVGAFAWIENEVLILHAVALSLDGSVQYDVEMTAPVQSVTEIGKKAADELLDKGADAIIDQIQG